MQEGRINHRLFEMSGLYDLYSFLGHSMNFQFHHQTCVSCKRAEGFFQGGDGFAIPCVESFDVSEC